MEKEQETGYMTYTEEFSENIDIDFAAFSNEKYIDTIIRMYNEAL